MSFQLATKCCEWRAVPSCNSFEIYRKRRDVMTTGRHKRRPAQTRSGIIHGIHKWPAVSSSRPLVSVSHGRQPALALADQCRQPPCLLISDRTRCQYVTQYSHHTTCSSPSTKYSVLLHATPQSYNFK